MKSLSTVQKFLLGLGMQSGNNQIAIRQLAELQPQILPLYALILVNACALAFTHYDFAPAWLTLGVPSVLLPLCILRGVQWWRLRPDETSPTEAVRHLRRTSIVTVLLSIGFVSWGLTLDGYGGAYHQAHVIVFVAITVIACIFCLSHLPTAAFLATTVVMGAFIPYYLASGNAVFVAIALNVLFVTIVMVRIIVKSFLSFLQLLEAQIETQRLVEENKRLALTDSLTSLPNRRYFFQHLDFLLKNTDKDQPEFALAIFDLDRFKPINDSYGHTAGDRVLEEAGRRLGSFANEDVIVARLGGDEFGLLTRHPGTAQEILAICNEICERLHIPVPLADTQVTPGCSGGLVLYPSGGQSADELFDRADYALYHSKERQRGSTTIFSQEHEDAIRAERTIEAALQRADFASEMEVHFQPVLDTTFNAITFVEGLARWNSPTLGRVSPDRFIAAAERCGMIHTLTIALLRKALADAVQLPSTVGLSFNLSSHDLVSPPTVVSIIAAVRESGFNPRRLTLELTETALMRDFEVAQGSIASLRAMGIKIALDDFGTGYSSLGYVHRLQLDKIKIDRSFLANIHSDVGRNVVITILDLCLNLKLDCIAEGVETEEQLRAVRSHGCRYVQGYLVGRPMPLAALLHDLEARAAVRGNQLVA
jgi:diguanylate cyclase (GGDEF)-like protein